MDYVGAVLGVAPVRVYEVATFYTMLNLEPTGANVIEVCTNTPCWLRGSEDIMHACERRLGIACGDTTTDRRFTLKETECLGACVNGPMCQVGENYYEDLTPESIVKIIDMLERGEHPKPGPQGGRTSSEPVEKK
jgi:NADH-quinone oxidoreductase subunit E